MNYKNINDYEQLYLIRENDDEAKNIIFEKYKPIIFSLASKYYNKSKLFGVDIDDLCQEGYIGLAKAIKSFKENMNACFYTFCTVCIERQMKTYCIRYNSNKNKIMNNACSLDMEIADNITGIDVIEDKDHLHNPFIYLTNSFNNNYLIGFKHSLPLTESLIFELRYNGFKYKEIANLLDVSTSCVDNCIHKIKVKLKKVLNK